MKNISSWGIIALMAIAVSGGVSGCKKDRDTPTPEPNPTPTPTLKEVSLAISLTNGGIIKEGKLVNDWVANDEVTIWGYAKEGKQPIELKATYRQSKKWQLNRKLSNDWLSVERASLMYLPSGEYDAKTESWKPVSISNKEVGNFHISSYYEDMLIANLDKVGDKISTTLNSPFRQVQLVLENSKYSQPIKNIELTLEDVVEGAVYSNGAWCGKSSAIKITYKDIEWAGGQSDELYIALPTNEQRVKATLKYQDSQGEQVIERDLVLESNRPTKLQFIFAEEPIDNPPLSFTLPIDVAYWEKANKDAFNLITSNLGTKYKMNEEFLRLMDFVVNRPLVDEAMHSRILYKDDMNLITWETISKTSYKAKKDEWGFAYGLETLDGRLVEVYPPTWIDEISHYSGNFLLYNDCNASYHYVTVPAGKYRLVLFISFPEFWGGEKDKWYKIPMMDSLGGGETLNGSSPYNKRLLEVIPMDKSPYKDIDIVEVIDRKTIKNTAPRWYMGYLYDNLEAYQRGDYLNTEENSTSWNNSYKERNILGITTINTSNQKLRGTIVARAEYLPMYNSIGYWRLEETAKYHYTWGKGGSYYYTPWSYEIGRTAVLLSPNTEEKVAIEITYWDDESWIKNGGRGVTYMGPQYYIHFYWVDEFGNEAIMMRVDYPMMNKIQRNNWAYSKKYFSLRKISSQPRKIAPEELGPMFANGFLF